MPEAIKPSAPAISWIDSHCHLHDDRLFFRLPEIFAAAKQAGVTGLIAVSAAYADWQRTLEAAAVAKSVGLTVIPALGIHPLWIDEASIDQALIELPQLLQQYPEAQLGEVGLDFYDKRLTVAQKNQQKDVFMAQFAIAKRLRRALLIHSRRADAELLEMLPQKDLPALLYHGFSGSQESALRLLQRGFVLGLGTVLLRPNARLRRYIHQLPLEAWLLETDAPFMMMNNTPATVATIGAELARLVGKNCEDIAKITHQTAQRLINPTVT